MSLKKYLFDHPVASVFLAWTGADIIRMGANLIKTKINCKHVERVNEQRIRAGCKDDNFTYACDVRTEREKAENNETTNSDANDKEGS